MEVKLRCSGTLLRVASLRLYIIPDSPMRVEIDVEFDSESLKSVTWSELKDSWMGGTAKIEVGNAAIDKLSLQGAGWIPRKLDGEIRDVVQTFVGFSIDEELYSWLLKSTTQSTEPFLLYQRKLKEKAWDFLGRCLGNKLMESTPTGVHFDRSIAPAACIAREKDWNHVEFLTALCQHLSHVDRKLEGWSTLGDKIWLLASAADPTIDLSEGWKVGGDGWTDSLLEGSPTSDSEMVIGSDSGNLVEFLIALTGANQLKFTWDNHELPRLPTLVSVNSKNYFCRKICYTFSFKGGDTYNWTCRCKLRRANRPPSSTPLRHVKLAGQFDKWADDDKYCLIKPIARAWKVVDTFMTDLVPDNEGLLAQIYVPGQSNETNRRDGLFFQCKSQDEIPFDLIPGDLPKAHGILQRKSDATDSLTFALIDGENRLSGTAQKTITITSEQDINLSAVKGKIKLEAKPLEIKASAVNISSPGLGTISPSGIKRKGDDESEIRDITHLVKRQRNKAVSGGSSSSSNNGNSTETSSSVSPGSDGNGMDVDLYSPTGSSRSVSTGSDGDSMDVNLTGLKVPNGPNDDKPYSSETFDRPSGWYEGTLDKLFESSTKQSIKVFEHEIIMVPCGVTGLPGDINDMDIGHKVPWKDYVASKNPKTVREAINAYNDPNNLRLEKPTVNRSHDFETDIKGNFTDLPNPDDWKSQKDPNRKRLSDNEKKLLVKLNQYNQDEYDSSDSFIDDSDTK